MKRKKYGKVMTVDGRSKDLEDDGTVSKENDYGSRKTQNKNQSSIKQTEKANRKKK